MTTHLAAANDNADGDRQIASVLSDLVVLLARAEARSAHEAKRVANINASPTPKG